MVVSQFAFRRMHRSRWSITTRIPPLPRMAGRGEAEASRGRTFKRPANTSSAAEPTVNGQPTTRCARNPPGGGCLRAGSRQGKRCEAETETLPVRCRQATLGGRCRRWDLFSSVLASAWTGLVAQGIALRIEHLRAATRAVQAGPLESDADGHYQHDNRYRRYG